MVNLRLLAFYLVFVGLALVTQLLMIVVLPYTLLFDSVKRNMEFRLYWAFVRFVATTFWTVREVPGSHSFSEVPGASVIVVNHQSNWDQAFCYLMDTYPKPRTLVKNAIRWFPVFNFTAFMLGEVYVGGGLHDAELSQISLEKSRRLLKQGVPLHIFPEGTRRFLQDAKERGSDPNIGEFRLGAFKLACEANVPVFPIVMELRHLVDDVKLEIYPGTMRYFIGCPISTKGKTPEQVKDEARDAMILAYARIGKDTKECEDAKKTQ